MLDEDEAPLTEAEMQALLEQFVRNKMEMERLAELNDTIKGYFKQTSVAPEGEPVYGTEKHGKFYVTRSANTRVNDALAKALYPPEEYPTYYKMALDTTKVKKYISPDDYKAIQNVFEPKIEIGLN